MRKRPANPQELFPPICPLQKSSESLGPEGQGLGTEKESQGHMTQEEHGRSVHPGSELRKVWYKVVWLPEPAAAAQWAW